jgi:hypothetical protein
LFNFCLNNFNHYSFNTSASPTHPAFLKKDGRHGFLNCIAVPFLQQYKLRTGDGHLPSKMWDKLGLHIRT